MDSASDFGRVLWRGSLSDRGFTSGDIESYYTIDLNAGYEIPVGPRPRLSVTVQNLLNRRHQQFIGAPEIGRLSMVRLTQTF